MNEARIAKRLKTLPDAPGVYRFLDVNGHLLYIGKATSLKKRVGSYFQRALDRRLEEMVAMADDIVATVTPSVLEALLLEAALIRAHQPPYNVRQKDDKTFMEIIITDEDYPRVLAIHPTQAHLPKIRYRFGPFTSATAARTALKLIRRIFPFRTKCTPRSGRACLDAHIGLCPGVCTGTITHVQYMKTIRRIRLLLEGKSARLRQQLERGITAAAKQQHFEEAAKLRDALWGLEHMQDTALIREEDFSLNVPTVAAPETPHRIEAYDISDIFGTYAVGGMVVFVAGKRSPSQYRKFAIRSVKGANDLAMLHEVLSRRLRHREWPLPDLFIIDGGLEQLKAARRALDEAHVQRPVMGIAKGPTRRKLDRYTNAPLPWPISDRLLLSLREEAHRFAIRYHRQRKRKSLLANAPKTSKRTHT